MRILQLLPKWFCWSLVSHICYMEPHITCCYPKVILFPQLNSTMSVKGLSDIVRVCLDKCISIMIICILTTVCLKCIGLSIIPIRSIVICVSSSKIYRWSSPSFSQFGLLAMLIAQECYVYNYTYMLYSRRAMLLHDKSMCVSVMTTILMYKQCNTELCVAWYVSVNTSLFIYYLCI